MGYDRRWKEDTGSEDSHARALWALGFAVGYSPNESVKAHAARLFYEALQTVDDFTSPRAWAITLIGIHAYLREFSGDSKAKRARERLSVRLFKLMKGNMSSDWPWFEDIVTYCNAKVPQSLLLSGQWTQKGEMVELALKSLRWLLEIQTQEMNQISLIGNDGWYPRNGEPSRFDQQPIEVMCLIEACMEAFNCTRDEEWLSHATRCFQWFLGQNDLRIPLYDFTTGGCRDGLHPDRVNLNQGSESTLAWLISLLRMHQIESEQALAEPLSDETKSAKVLVDPRES